MLGSLGRGRMVPAGEARGGHGPAGLRAATSLWLMLAPDTPEAIFFFPLSLYLIYYLAQVKNITFFIAKKQYVVNLL